MWILNNNKNNKNNIEALVASLIRKTCLFSHDTKFEVIDLEDFKFLVKTGWINPEEEEFIITNVFMAEHPEFIAGIINNHFEKINLVGIVDIKKKKFFRTFPFIPQAIEINIKNLLELLKNENITDNEIFEIIWAILGDIKGLPFKIE